MRTDCHQHLWPVELLDALRRRTSVPRVRDGVLHLAGEPPCAVDATAHDVDARRAREHAEGTDRVLLSLSSPLGIEHLRGDDAAELLDLWHAGATALGEPFGVWAAASVVEPDLEGLARVLRGERVVGLQLPATALADPAALERAGPVLEVLERAGKPLLVHPGPAPAAADGLPPWWPALVPYVAQLQAAWMAWHVRGRAQHPDLRVAFVALAGLAPLHHERLAARGGRLGPLDPHVFYETSSYGTRAVDATLRVVGVDALVHGSDRPYAEPCDPGLGQALTHALVSTNPRNLLMGAPR